MKTILKYLAVVGLLAHGAFAAGTWVAAPNPTGIKFDTTFGYDWDFDSKGNVWYTITRNGVYFQEKTGTQLPVKQTAIPDSVIKKRAGIFVDPKTDSVYVGGKGGHIWVGKDGNWREMAAQVPLIGYRKNFQPYDKANEVGDLQRDSQGRLIAITDSLAWWHDTATNEWKPISTYDKYTCGNFVNGAIGHGFLAASILDKNGVIWATSGGGALVRINLNLTVDSLPCKTSYANNPFIAPNGDMLNPGNGRAAYYRRKWPDFASAETTSVIPKGEWGGENTPIGVYEDANGYLWIGESNRTIIWKDGDRLIMPVTGAMSYFHLTPDSTFWAFSETANLLHRYSEKYSIPPEANSAIQGKRNAGAQQSLSIQVLGNRIQLNCQGRGRYLLSSIDGRSSFKGTIHGGEQLLMPSGMWLVQLVSEQNGSVSKSVFIP